jgi:tRNA A-37 threonylcarbamoyl transferase component Bud32
MTNIRQTSQSLIPFTVLEQIIQYSDWESGRLPSHTFEGYERLIYLDLHTGVTNGLDEIEERTRYAKTTYVQGTLMFPK